MIRFDEQPFLDAAEILVMADETERALALLNNLPAICRDFVPPKIQALKNEILNKMTLPYDLMHDGREMPKSDEWSVHYLKNTARGQALMATVEDSGHPHIVDMGPGDFTFAIGLHKLGYSFSYECFTLNADAKSAMGQRLQGLLSPGPDSPRIFVAFEIIEHLSNIYEIRQCYERVSPKPEKILLSTPKYTYERGTPTWRTDGIHHLRAYTPREFLNACMNMFPEYALEIIDDPVMVIAGTLKK